MIYLCPEIVGCRIVLLKQKKYNFELKQWQMIDADIIPGLVIGYSKKENSGSGSFNLICLDDDGVVSNYNMGGCEHEYTFRIHEDDLPYLRKKMQDRFRRGVSLKKEKEIPRESLIDLEE